MNLGSKGPRGQRPSNPLLKQMHLQVVYEYAPGGSGLLGGSITRGMLGLIPASFWLPLRHLSSP